MKNQVLFIFSFVFLLSCSPEPEALNFGSDECHYCKMSIVDQRYGAEIVTRTGKVFKFDAIECMVNSLCENQDKGADNYHSAYVIDFINPATLVNAEKATYLYSTNLPSPMGAFLTGFENMDGAEMSRSNYQGDILNWKELVLKVRGEQPCAHDL